MPTCSTPGCGKPSHPCYGERCEDCWVDSSEARSTLTSRWHRVFGKGTAIGQRRKGDRGAMIPVERENVMGYPDGKGREGRG